MIIKWQHVAFIVAMALALFLPPADAADLSSPVGLWKTIDDNSGKPGGLIRIAVIEGQYQGKIEKIFIEPGEDPNPRCIKCDGVRRNQPVIGMTFMWGLTKQGDEYNGGDILDPKTGRLYRAKMTLEDGGTKLNVRGFIGFSLLGRTQVWFREE
ncbi:MAG: DUF2147 domain-containing protein [Nitrospirota bacterium]|nr:DUF2147 domain-containing protein [Nitrospirota bacterium]